MSSTIGYKLKRPSKGYNTEKEREFAKWSSVSDWDVYFEDKKIGSVSYIGTVLTDWIWDIENPKLCGEAPTRQWAFENLISAHQLNGGAN